MRLNHLFYFQTVFQYTLKSFSHQRQLHKRQTAILMDTSVFIRPHLRLSALPAMPQLFPIVT